MYNPNIHHRRSIRLKGYDYSQQGLYFVTVCVQGRACLFGEIINQEMIVNDAGRMIEKWYVELENKFPDIECGEYMVMPNHFHAIIENIGANKPGLGDGAADGHVGADLRVRPNDPNERNGSKINGSGFGDDMSGLADGVGGWGEHIGSPLHRVVQWFKTMSTNEYIRNVKTNNWPRFDGKLWQRNYWEHIIRNQKSYQRISDYIINNPKNWDTDSINPNNK